RQLPRAGHSVIQIVRSQGMLATVVQWGALVPNHIQQEGNGCLASIGGVVVLLIVATILIYAFPWILTAIGIVLGLGIILFALSALASQAEATKAAKELQRLLAEHHGEQGLLAYYTWGEFKDLVAEAEHLCGEVEAVAAATAGAGSTEART